MYFGIICDFQAKHMQLLRYGSIVKLINRDCIFLFPNLKWNALLLNSIFQSSVSNVCDQK